MQPARGKIGLLGAALVALSLVVDRPASADSVSLVIPDIGTFTSFTNSNTTDMYTGTGFVGLYQSSFGHLFGLEELHSKTALNVDVSALVGSTINSAFLNFDLLQGDLGTQTVTATSFDAGGTLGHFFSPPSDLGSLPFTVTGRASNSLDVTSLLASRVGAGEGWFGLHLQGSSLRHWTYSDDNADAASVRLVVDYTPASVAPEPGSMALLASGVLGLLHARRRRASLPES